MNVRAQWIALLWIGLMMGLVLGGAACSSTSEDDVSDSNRDGGGNGDGDGDNGDGDGDGDNGDGDGDGDGDVTPGDGDGDNGDGDGDGDGDDVEVLDAGDGIICGSQVCPMGGCCADPFQSLCGAAIGATGCIKPPEPDENSDVRCPEIQIGGFFTLPSCCTEDGDCGINASQFAAGADCVELSVFKMRALEMAGGGPDGGGMLFFDIPEPKRCSE